jgi:Xaa-Pro aminopeptidase
MAKAVEIIKRMGLKPRRIGVEYGFLPYDASKVLRDAFSDAELVEAALVLDRQRAIKTPEELEKLKFASEAVIESMKAVIESMKAVIASHGAGSTKKEIWEALRREETNRGLTFEYCLITAGSSHNRGPSDQRWEEGEALSLDSGGNYQGYIGDLCRMAVLGEPDSELKDLLGEIETIQRAGFKAVKPGATGRDIYAAAEPLVAKSKYHNNMEFLAHGMGLVSHEAPRLTDRGPVKYQAEHRDKPIEAGMVVSVETTLLHPTRGFIKLEDTLAVTESGHEIYGEGARGWNRGGTAISH